MKKLHRSVVYLLLLTSALSTTALVYTWRHSVRCKIRDLTASLTIGPAKELEGTLGAWVRHAKECRVGEFLIDIPAESTGSGRISIVREGRAVLIVDGESTTILFDQSGKRVQFQSRRSQPASPRDFISYEGFDPAQNAFIENVDTGADGTVDIRFTEVVGRPRKSELRIEDRWLELVTSEGKSGVFVDGQFMSVEKARAKIEAKGR